MNLTGGILSLGQLDCFRVDGISTGSLLVVELAGICPYTDGIALLVKAGGTGVTVGKAGVSGSWRFELKGW